MFQLSYLPNISIRWFYRSTHYLGQNCPKNYFSKTHSSMNTLIAQNITTQNFVWMFYMWFWEYIKWTKKISLHYNTSNYFCLITHFQYSIFQKQLKINEAYKIIVLELKSSIISIKIKISIIKLHKLFHEIVLLRGALHT